LDTKLLGRWGEARAADYLRGKGYKIIGLNYTTRFGEIDIIAEWRNVVAFVEVKLRRNDRFAAAREYVDAAKQAKIVTTAGLWLVQNQTEKQPRFDVIEVYAPQGIATVAPKINHIPNAFQAREGNHV